MCDPDLGSLCDRISARSGFSVMYVFASPLRERTVLFNTELLMREKERELERYLLGPES